MAIKWQLNSKKGKIINGNRQTVKQQNTANNKTRQNSKKFKVSVFEFGFLLEIIKDKIK